MQPQISLGISPCPNDTFIFHALLHGLAPADPGFSLSRLVVADVEELNGLAARAELDVVKISLAAVADIDEDYLLLSCGAALGRGCGPLLVTRADRDLQASIDSLALPGARTTATLLAEMACISGERRQMRYDQVLPAVAAGEVDAGVVIHEGRFTYEALGLRLIMDFGVWWEGKFGLPLPLGAIAAKRSLGIERLAQVEAAIRASLGYAWKHPEAGSAFVAGLAQELSPEVIRSHIETFVTPFSLNMGEEGRRAVTALAGAAFELACRKDGTDRLFG